MDFENISVENKARIKDLLLIIQAVESDLQDIDENLTLASLLEAISWSKELQELVRGEQRTTKNTERPSLLFASSEDKISGLVNLAVDQQKTDVVSKWLKSHSIDFNQVSLLNTSVEAKKGLIVYRLVADTIQPQDLKALNKKFGAILDVEAYNERLKFLPEQTQNTSVNLERANQDNISNSIVNNSNRLDVTPENITDVPLTQTSTEAVTGITEIDQLKRKLQSLYNGEHIDITLKLDRLDSNKDTVIGFVDSNNIPSEYYEISEALKKETNGEPFLLEIEKEHTVGSIYGLEFKSATDRDKILIEIGFPLSFESSEGKSFFVATPLVVLDTITPKLETEVVKETASNKKDNITDKLFAALTTSPQALIEAAATITETDQLKDKLQSLYNGGRININNLFHDGDSDDIPKDFSKVSSFEINKQPQAYSKLSRALKEETNGEPFLLEIEIDNTKEREFFYGLEFNSAAARDEILVDIGFPLIWENPEEDFFAVVTPVVDLDAITPKLEIEVAKETALDKNNITDKLLSALKASPQALTKTINPLANLKPANPAVSEHTTQKDIAMAEVLTPQQLQRERTSLIAPIVKDYLDLAETHHYEGKLHTASWDKTSKTLSLVDKPSSTLKLLAKLETGQWNPLPIPLANSQQPNLTKADVQHFQAIAPKIAAKFEEKRATYRAWYESAKTQVLAAANGTTPSPQEIDRAIALSVLADSSDPNDVGRVLAQSDVVQNWKTSLPQEEFQQKLVDYVQATYTQVTSNSPRQEHKNSQDLAR